MFVSWWQTESCQRVVSHVFTVCLLHVDCCCYDKVVYLLCDFTYCWKPSIGNVIFVKWNFWMFVRRWVSDRTFPWPRPVSGSDSRASCVLTEVNCLFTRFWTCDTVGLIWDQWSCWLSLCSAQITSYFKLTNFQVRFRMWSFKMCKDGRILEAAWRQHDVFTEP